MMMIEERTKQNTYATRCNTLRQDAT